MAEYISTTPQVLAAGQAVALQTNVVCGGCNIMHRQGSPLISVKGSGCCKNPHYYKVLVHVVVEAVDTNAVQLAVAVDGVVLPETTIALPPVAVGTLISGDTAILVPADCGCSKVSVEAVTAATVDSIVVIVTKE